MFDPLALLFDHLVLYLLLCAHLLLHQLPLLLLLGLLLLRLDHLLKRVVLQVLLMAHHVHEVFLLLLLLLHVVCLPAHFVLNLATLHLQGSPLLLFDFKVDLFSKGFFLFFLALDCLSLLLLLHVSLFGNENIRGAFLGLIELLPCLYNAYAGLVIRSPYLLFFLLEECDPVRE